MKITKYMLLLATNLIKNECVNAIQHRIRFDPARSSVEKSLLEDAEKKAIENFEHPDIIIPDIIADAMRATDVFKKNMTSTVPKTKNFSIHNAEFVDSEDHLGHSISKIYLESE